MFGETWCWVQKQVWRDGGRPQGDIEQMTEKDVNEVSISGWNLQGQDDALCGSRKHETVLTLALRESVLYLPASFMCECENANLSTTSIFSSLCFQENV